MNYRDSILVGAREAARLHDRLGLRHNIEKTGGGVDIFNVALQLKSTVLFRDLTGILGAYLNEDGANGILVTTQRRLPIQRFTGAHEVGHLVLGHEPSIDGEEILNGQSAALDPVEVEANGFAGEFMAPKWLLAHHARQQGWNAVSMTDPEVVYQLALRIGLSYEATRRSLANHGIVGGDAVQLLRGRAVKDIKRSVLPAEYTPPNWYGDVWVLTEKDRGTRIDGHPDDLFVVKVKEKSAAGYLWDIDALKREGFDILTNRGIPPSGDGSDLYSDVAIGGEICREVTAGGAKQTTGHLSLAHRRPWQSTKPIAEISVDYDLSGKESGLPRVQRRNLQAA